MNNSNFRAYNNLGNALRKRNSIYEAISQYKQAIKISKGTFPIAYLNIAGAYFESNDIVGCIDNLEKAMQDGKGSKTMMMKIKEKGFH